MQCEEVKFCGQAARGEGGAGGGVVAVRLGGAALCVQQSLLLEFGSQSFDAAAFSPFFVPLRTLKEDLINLNKYIFQITQT